MMNVINPEILLAIDFTKSAEGKRFYMK